MTAAGVPAAECTTAACVLCASTGDEVVLHDNGHVGRRCACGVVYTDPQPVGTAMETIVDFHPDSYYEDPAKLRFAFVDTSRKRAGGNSVVPKFLEVGAGHGHVARRARDAGYDVTAIEPNPVTAAELRELGFRTEEARLHETRLAAHSFDVVFHIDLLSHFADPVEALNIMKRLVAVDGIVCFEVGVFGGLSPRWYRWMGRAGYPQHLWFYSHDNLHALFDAAGLQVVARQDYSLWAGTALSTIGNRYLSRLLPKPDPDRGAPPRTSGVRRAYGLLQHHLRYTLGRRLPALGGPQCSLYALSRAGAGRS